jgi:serine protease Do
MSERRPAAAGIELDLEAVVRDLRAATVRVHDGRRGSGSGVVWNRSGLVITNAHVARGKTATVELPDGRTARAAVVRRDPSLDLAAIRIPADAQLVAARFRDSRTLRPGELLVAVGHPYGLVGSATLGLLQRCNARWVVADVRLAPGNSGGPLADAAGRLVGINSMVANGLALAVPSATVAKFLGEDARAA